MHYIHNTLSYIVNLNSFSTIQQLCIQYNYILLSLTLVERIFSIATPSI